MWSRAVGDLAHRRRGAGCLGPRTGVGAEIELWVVQLQVAGEHDPQHSGVELIVGFAIQRRRAESRVGHATVERNLWSRPWCGSGLACARLELAPE